jgi:hypothetical protein
LKTPPTTPIDELVSTGQPCWPLSSTQFEVDSLQIAVYPNPVSYKLYIETKRKGKRELYNSVGQLLFTTDNNEIDVSTYASGCYYLKVKNSVRKVVIE